MSINLIGRFNRAGVENDVKIFGQALEELGFQVTYSDFMRRPLYYKFHKKICFDANIFIEKINPLYLPGAKKNFVKPNQEFIFSTAEIDAVFTKTRYAQTLFAELGVKSHYMGFCSLDRKKEGVAKEPFVLHMTSRSTLKGTKEIIEAWKRYPELPKLVILLQPLFEEFIIDIPNVEWINRFLSDEELKTLQNRAAFHLCPSYTEGFGHCMMEGLSTGSLVITTNAPPMNEFVTEERGVLSPWTAEVPIGYGKGYYCSPEQIRDTVLRAFALPDAKERGERGRAFFESLRPQFLENLKNILKVEL